MFSVILNIYFPWFKERFYKFESYVYKKFSWTFIFSLKRNFFFFFFFFGCRTTSMQLMALILPHGSHLIDKLVLGVENNYNTKCYVYM